MLWLGPKPDLRTRAAFARSPSSPLASKARCSGLSLDRPKDSWNSASILFRMLIASSGPVGNPKSELAPAPITNTIFRFAGSIIALQLWTAFGLEASGKLKPIPPCGATGFSPFGALPLQARSTVQKSAMGWNWPAPQGRAIHAHRCILTRDP